MRVVDVSSFFSDACGGIKSYYRAKARFLPPLGADCHFVVPGARAGEQAFGRGTLHRIAGPPVPGNGAYRLFGRPGELARLIARLAPDVVEIGSHYVLPAMVARALRELVAPWRRRPAVVGFFHSDVARTLVEPVARRLPGPVGRRLMSAAWRFVRWRHGRYDATFVGSRAMERLLAEQGVPRVAWVGLGVDAELFCPGAGGRSSASASASASVMAERGRPTMVYVGRLSGDKGFPLVLEAYDAIAAATGARLRIVGDGPARRRAERFAASRAGVTVEGYLDAPADVAAALAGADVALSPGGRETFSLATAEALACATPVVAADDGGAEELVAGSGGGLTFRAGSAVALADAAIALLGRPIAARRAMGAAGRAHVARTLTWPAVMARIYARYDQLVAAPAERRAA